MLENRVPEVEMGTFSNHLKIKTMKRVMLAAMLLVSTVTVFASETNGSTIKEEKKILIELNEEKGECTYSISAKVGPSWGQVEIKCSYTATTCKEAISKANSCVEEARKAIMQ